MKFLKRPLTILAFVILLASFLRLYDLGKVPQSLNWDEVSLGYNAYSILKTGADEYGKALPVVLQSFDDYKPALYTYLAIPTVGLLGLTAQAVRLPSAFAGIGAVVIVYFLVLSLLGNKSVNISGREIKPFFIAILASFFLAISPWHIQFSRIAFESNVGLTINLLGFYLFLKGIKNKYFLPLSFVFFALNIHMYQSDRVFSPLLAIALCLIFYKKLLASKKVFLLSTICALIVAMPLIIYILTNQNALLRAKGVSVFSEQSLVRRSSDKLLNDSKTNNLIGKVLDNRRTEYGKAIINGYISHFDPNWLFITGDIARHHAPYMGLLYLFTLPFLLIGIYVMVFLKIERKYKFSFFAYFLLVPIPASITSGVPHAVRTLNFAWTYELFIALGLMATIVFVLSQKNKFLRIILILLSAVYCLLSTVNIAYYLNQYFVQLNYYNASDWLYGYKEAISYIDQRKGNYDKIVIENEVPFDQSYMFFLFYLKVDPLYYQSLGGTNSGGFKEKHKGFYNFTFEPITDQKYEGKILLMGKASDVGSDVKNRKVIYFPDGTEAVAIGEK